MFLSNPTGNAPDRGYRSDRSIKNEVIRSIVLRKRDVQDDDHDDKVAGAPGLEVTQRTEN